MGLTLTANKFERKYWICAILLFIISFPKFVWGMGDYIMLFAQILLFLFCFDDIRNHKASIMRLTAFCLQVIFVCVAFTNEYSNLVGRVMSFVNGLSFATIFFCSPKFWRSCIDCFIRLLAFLLIFAIVEHILISFLDISFPSTIIEECPTNKGRSYMSFIFNVYHETAFSHVSRFYAFYDEPGVLGNILMVLLFLQKFNLKKWYNIVFLISGILTFSLAFYIAVGAYYVISAESLKIKILFVIVVAILIYFTTGNEFIEYYIFRRLEFVDGTLAGYNREKANFDAFFEKLKIQDYLFVGYTPRSMIRYAASWKWAFVLYGIIPSILYFLVTQLSNWRLLPHKEDMIKVITLAVIIWIQRPFIHYYLYALLFVVPAVYYSTLSDDN